MHKATGDEAIGDADWPAYLRSLYESHGNDHAHTPFISPVLRTGLDIHNMIVKGYLDIDQISAIVNQLRQSALTHRARKLAAYLGTCDAAENTDALEAVIRQMVYDDYGALVEFSVFQARIHHIYYTLVLTAHPTFTMPLNDAVGLAKAVAQIARGESPDDALLENETGDNRPPDLQDEEEYSLAALDNLHAAYDTLLDAVLSAGRALYPGKWHKLRPRLFSAASWVGFDLDGRADIQWARSMEKRITLQLRQLAAYDSEIAGIIQAHPRAANALKPALEDIRTTLTHMHKHQAFFAAYQQHNDSDLADLQENARLLIADAAERVTSPAPLLERVEYCLNEAETTDRGLITALIKLRARLESFGISRAEMHFRINANQLHNAIGTRVGLSTHPDHASRRHSYLAAIGRLIDAATPVNIDFGDIANERMTAKYEFMLIQQITSYIDTSSPVRFLIAESESAFTVLTALYYAHRFGVADKVDICPLFETQRALRDGARYLQQLLQTPVWQDYLKRRGRLCIQLGYSDSGRYIGQPPAGASIERLKERVIDLLVREGRSDCTLVFFDTHGESPGRGAHPDSLSSRLAYICSPHLLQRMADAGIAHTLESSYQGGDGMIPLLSQDGALAVLARSIAWLVNGHANSGNDPYYDEPARSEVTEFLTFMANFQTAMIGTRGYADLLNAFSTNIIYPTGSRAAKRVASTEAATQRQAVEQFRAIPHNAILGQLGVMANTTAGIGQALREHAELAERLDRDSPRYRMIMRLVETATAHADPQIMKAYATLLDPTFWVICAGREVDETHANKLAEIATQLEQHDMHDTIMGVYRKLEWDDTLLRRYRNPGTAPVMRDLACLHAIRLALMYRCFELAADIPRFGPRHAVSREQLMRLVFHMDITSVSHSLEQIFPAEDADVSSYDFGEHSQYRQQSEQPGYTNIRDNITTPLQDMHDLTRRISTVIGHYMGFIG